ncbi:MAG: DHH family phosphoesterase [Ruminococcaceae bacterium]|nr:DHH family phosphoesterase [Oscillospiraceae bacterium]
MNKKLKRHLQQNTGYFYIILLVFVIAAAVMGNYILALAEGVVTLVLLIAFLVSRSKRRKDMQLYLQTVTDSMNTIEGATSPLPVVVVRLEDSGIVFANELFTEISGYKEGFRQHLLQELLPDFPTDWLSAGKSEYPYDVTLDKRRYRVYGTAIIADDSRNTRLGFLYFVDLNELYQVRDEYIRTRPVVSIILVDNYEELTKNLTESAISLLNADIHNAITKWTDKFHGLLRRLEKNRYMLIFEKRYLQTAIDGKFSILEDIHEITSPSGLPASISFGLGVDGANFSECYEFASLAIEMALGRGGDQAVIKNRLNFDFYGGRSKENEAHSRVRSRINANSLMELIGQSNRVFVMGHKIADLDAIGAALGVCCMCRKKGKPAHIVMDTENNVVGKLLDEIRAVPEYESAFISGEEALLHCDNRSLLVVVDTNRPDQVEFMPLLDAATKICLIDHHRRAADYIKEVVVTCHEVGASSACELTTELMEYVLEKKDILPIEAKALMAGIFLDTKSFNVRTGERTFEAAAYLKQIGADTTEVKQLLQTNFQDTIAKYQIIKTAKLYRQEIAIAALNGTTTRALAAQAADELLNISGITASFVLYQAEDRVYMSARSMGNVNVQMILEPLGGGGNGATAGAQIKDSTVERVLEDLVASIDKYYEE